MTGVGRPATLLWLAAHLAEDAKALVRVRALALHLVEVLLEGGVLADARLLHAYDKTINQVQT